MRRQGRDEELVWAKRRYLGAGGLTRCAHRGNTPHNEFGRETRRDRLCSASLLMCRCGLETRGKAEFKTKVSGWRVAKFLRGIQDEQRLANCQTILEIMKKATRAEPRMWGSGVVAPRGADGAIPPRGTSPTRLDRRSAG
jgi:hypothetical protein